MDHSTDWMQRDDSERDLAEDCALVGWADVKKGGGGGGREVRGMEGCELYVLYSIVHKNAMHLYHMCSNAGTHTQHSRMYTRTHTPLLLPVLEGLYWLGWTNTRDLLRGDCLGPTARMYSGRFSLFSEDTVGVCLPRAAMGKGGKGSTLGGEDAQHTVFCKPLTGVHTYVYMSK